MNLNPFDQQIAARMTRLYELGQDSLTNQCGDCNVCCVAPGITDPPSVAELGGIKPSGSPCKNCIKGGGCSIYEARPPVCKGYECLYRMGLFDHRPDSDGVAWTFQQHECPNGMILLMGHAMDCDTAFKTESVLDVLLNFAVQSKLTTCIVVRDSKHVFSWIHGPETQALVCKIDPDTEQVDYSTEWRGPRIGDLVREFNRNRNQQP